MGSTTKVTGTAAAVVVWKALWMARKRLNSSKKKKKPRPIDEFALCDAVVMDDNGSPAFWLSDNRRMLEGTLAVETLRERCELAEALYATDEIRLVAQNEPAGDFAAIVSRRRLARYRHTYPRAALSQLMDAVWVPARSALAKKRLDQAARALARAVETGSRKRVEILESLWVLENDVPRFERALCVVLVVVKRTARSETTKARCQGEFCRGDDPVRFAVAGSAVATAAGERKSGEALDFWPHSLIEWCIERQFIVAPQLDVAFPRSGCVLAPGKTCAIQWSWRGPPRPVTIDLVIVLDRIDLLEDGLLMTERRLGTFDRCSVDWPVPLEVNGSSNACRWQLRFSADIAPGYPPLTVVSDVFVIDKLESVSTLAARRSRSDAESARGLLETPSARFVARWDSVRVCEVCADIYADLAERRTAWLAKTATCRRPRHAVGDTRRRACDRLAEPRRVHDIRPEPSYKLPAVHAAPPERRDSAFVRNMPLAAARLRYETPRRSGRNLHSWQRSVASRFGSCDPTNRRTSNFDSLPELDDAAFIFHGALPPLE